MKNTLSFALSLIGKLCADCGSSIIVLLFFAFIAIPQFSYAQISGTPSVCVGSNRTLTDGMTGPIWSSSNSAIATVGSSSGIVHGATAGTVHIYCTNGTINDTFFFTVNPVPTFYNVSGGGSFCAGGTGLHVGLVGSTSGINYQLYDGTTIVGSSVTGLGLSLDFGLQTDAGIYTVVASNPTTACSDTMTGSATITVNAAALPICGPTAVCTGASFVCCYPAGPGGGTWTSSLPSTATIGSATGIVVGVTTGTTIITYTLPSGCYSTEPVTVSAGPCALPAIAPVCISSPLAISDCIPGGTWTSSNISVAAIGTFTGIVTGVAVGIATITYSLGSGCTVTTTLSVISAPAAIAGPSSTCAGSTITLSDATSSGTWSSSNTAVATVSSSGVVTGASAGVVTISYTIGSCSATKIVTIYAIPATIGGLSSVCMGSTITETDTSTGGSWSVAAVWLATVGSATGIVSGVGAGSTIISYTVGGCSATRTITVNAASPITGFAGMCVGAATTLSDAFSGGTWSSSATGIATVTGSTGVVNGVSAGTSVISYTMPAGCYVTTTVTVSPFPGPVSAPLYLCNGSCITLSAGISGGAWSSSLPSLATVDAGTGLACGLAPGSVTFTYLAGGCSATATLTVNPTPPAISGPTTLCSGSSVTYTDVFSGGTWSSSTSGVATIGTSGVATGISSGTAILSYSFSTGCSAILPVNVYPYSGITGPSSVCIGQTIVLTDAVGGGAWSSGSTGVATINSSGLVSGITAGTATISYNLPGGCVATAVISVNALPLPVTGSHTVCVSSTITLSDATSGGIWSSLNTAVATVFGAGNVAGISAGVDTIQYAYPGGCFTIFAVTVNAIPDTISGPGSDCIGGVITLADPSPFGTWASSAPAIATVGSSSGAFTGLTTGSVTITYGLPTGCHVTKAVTVNPAPLSISGITSLCPGGLSLLADLTPGGTWSSSNTSIATINPSTGVLSGLVPGSSVITYNSGPGCLVTTSVVVNPLPATISGSTLLCQGASVTLTDITPGGSWSSTNPSIVSVTPGGVITGVAAGTANIDYILGSGCMSEIGIVVDPLPATISGIPLVCVGLITSLSDVTPGGTWSSSNTAIAPISISGTVTGIAAGIATITYTATTGCITTVAVGVNPPPTPITGASLICATTSTLYTDDVSGGEWLSSNPGVAAAGSSSGIITGVSTGTAVITYMTGAGCQLTKSITVDPVPLPVSGPGSICTGIPTTMTDATPGGVWASSAPALASVGSLSGTVEGYAGGIVAISYTLGCTITHLITVNVMPSMITGPGYTCTGRTVILTDSITGGTWTSSAPSIAFAGSSTGMVTGISVGSTTIDYTMPGGCFSSTTITITAPPAMFTITGGGNYCADDSGVHIGLTGSETGVNYLLYRGTTPTGTFAGTGSPLDFGWQTVTGSYTVTATNVLSACSTNMTGSVTVNVTPVVVPHVSVTTSQGDTICSGTLDSFTAHPVNGGVSPFYQWQVNGVTTGTGPVYAYLPVNGDVVKVKMASSAVCAVPDTVYKSDTITVNTSANPVVTISASPGDTVCKGTIVSLSESTLFGGTAPTFSWVKNGVLSGSGAIFTFLPTNNDIIYCVVHSNYICRLSDVDTSGLLVLTVDTPATPVVTLFASPASTVSPGDTVTLTATATNGGTSPAWQWYKNGILITGATNSTYVIDSFSTPQTDSFTCHITSSGPCVSSSAQTILVTVTTVGVKQLSLSNISVNVLPNPNKGEFTISGTTGISSGSGNDEYVTISITDMPGQLIYKTDLHTINGILNERLRLEGILAKGTYLLTLKSASGIQVFHLVIGD